jgi:hypothetical protein
MLKTIFIILTLWILVISIASANKYGASLMGDINDNSVRLAWSLTHWPAEMIGFTIAKRSQGQSWQPLTKATIEPGLWENKDLSLVEPNPSQRMVLTKKFKQLVIDGKIKLVSRDEFIARALTDKELLPALRREIIADYNRALYIGLGLIDRNVEIEPSLEYGLFSVETGPNNGSLLATFSMAAFQYDGKGIAENLKIDPLPDGNLVSWKVPERTVQAYSTFAFNVYRYTNYTNDIEDLEKLTTTSIGSAQISDSWRHWSFLDLTAKKGTSYFYAISPVNVFHTQLPKITRTHYDASLDNIKFNLVTVSQQSKGDIKLSWEFSGAADSFQINRLTLNTIDNKTTPEFKSPLLMGNTREYIDQADGASRWLQYFITAKIADREFISNTLNLPYVDPSQLEAPNHLQLSTISSDTKRFIHAKWQSNITEDTFRGFLLTADLHDPGVFDQVSSLLDPATHEFFIPLSNLVAREILVEVAHVSDEGVIGEAIQKSILVAGAYVPPPSDLKVSKEGKPGEQKLRLIWQYSATEALEGFMIRITRDDQFQNIRVAPNVRDFYIRDIEPYQTYSIELVAVTSFGDQSVATTASYLYLPD